MSRLQPLSVRVERVIKADPSTLYDIISDITRMNEFSPETTRTSWIDGADCAVVGAKFKGHNAIGRTKWATKPTITRAEAGKAFAFQVPGAAGPLWTYEFTPVAGGTRVVESMQQDKVSPLIIRLLQRGAGVTDRAAHLRQGMTVTLERLALVAESGRPAEEGTQRTFSAG